MSESTADESLPVSAQDASRARWASAGTLEAYDELRNALQAPGAATAAPTAHWSSFFDALGPGGPRDSAAELAARAARVQRRVREDGVTYNVHAEEGAEASREWPLQLLPFIIDADQWAAIERGVLQRARLLNATLADVYGAQTLLREAVLPPSLVFAHPQYLRPVHGVCRWAACTCTWRHSTSRAGPRAAGGCCRSGCKRRRAGLSAGNRLLVAQEFPEAFDALHVQRVAGAFGAC